MSIEVLSAGFLTTVQDLGRENLVHLGISPGGAADPLALRVANRLVGNKESAACIEMTASGANFRFHQPTWIAYAGADCRITLDGEPLAAWTSYPVRVGQVLRIGSFTGGLRGYLSVLGGIEVPMLMNSRSNFLSAAFGGHEGRPLTSGDLLRLGSHEAYQGDYRRASIHFRHLYLNLCHTETVRHLRVTKGRQASWLSDEAFQQFLQTNYQLSDEADRKGLRFRGPELKYKAGAGELTTEGLTAGTVQIPPSGQPLLLFCEQQTTGGYPKIAQVITADLFLIGQLRPGDHVRFSLCSLEEAWQLQAERTRAWQSMIQPA